jgi:acyltransferase
MTESSTVPVAPKQEIVPDLKPARYGWIDVARGIAMLLVIIGHATPKSIPPLVVLHQWLYSFHIPLFFFITGLLTKAEARDVPWRDVVTKAARSLMLPYLLFGIIAYLAWLLALRHFGVKSAIPIPLWYPTLGILYGSFNSPLAILDAPIWFFPCLFCALLVNRALPRGVTAEAIAVGLVFAAGVAFVRLCPWRFPWGLDLACLVLPFMYAGRKLRPLILNMSSARQWQCLLLVPFLVAIQTYCGLHNSEVNIANGHIGQVAPFLAAGFAGTLATLFLSRVLPEAVLGSFIGRNTIIVFPMHLFCFSVIAAAIMFSASFHRFVFSGRYTTLGVYVGLTLAGLTIIVPVMKVLFPWLMPAPRAPRSS